MAGALQIVSPSLAVGHGIGVETLRCWSKAGGLSMASSSSSLYCRIDSLSVRRARCGSWIQNSSRVDGPARAWRLSQRSKGNSSRCRAERDDENSAGRGGPALEDPPGGFYDLHHFKTVGMNLNCFDPGILFLFPTLLQFHFSHRLGSR